MTLITACCFGCTLLAQIKQQSSTPGFSYCGASALEMEKKKVGFSSIMSKLKSSTLQGFSAVDHDFLCLLQLLKAFCNHDYHVSQIKLGLNKIALLCGTFEMHHLASDRLNPKTLILIWDTEASAGLTPFRSNFIDYVKCEIDV